MNNKLKRIYGRNFSVIVTEDPPSCSSFIAELSTTKDKICKAVGINDWDEGWESEKGSRQYELLITLSNGKQFTVYRRGGYWTLGGFVKSNDPDAKIIIGCLNGKL